MPQHRAILLKKALKDLTEDPYVLAVYLCGSLAKGDFDNFSDIDLHTIVLPEKKESFIKGKRERAQKWGEVLFFEGFNPFVPHVVTHYDTFVKVDSWYHTPEEIIPSIWLKELEVLHDPHNTLSKIKIESSKLVYEPSSVDVEFWRGKILAFIHETYRAVMRNEIYYALSNLERLRWLIVSSWYLEMEEHLDSPYGVWSKIEGKRSKLKQWQLSLLENWDTNHNSNGIMKTMVSIIPEFYRLNKHLSKKVQIDSNEENIKKIVEMAY
ncbi:nucleotidyltransferase domain-containing protein [Neobacillus terrae]|uniref:nucleotidyltransferase domain-containing protein n=1 Tax=Neobacillus terrae TaxID=3034837 RepID=UPI001FB0D3BC|nr:nucleotidyltransferase domain-containing protein [Neobacillus terrae]